MVKRKIDWREVVYALEQDEGNELHESRKSARVTKTNVSTCTMCASSERHNMKCQLLECKSKMCEAACPGVKCAWRGKLLTCRETKTIAVYETGEHFTDVRSPRKNVFTRQQKGFCKELSAQWMKPVRVRNALRTRFRLDADRVPRLRSIQNFVNYYAKAHLSYNDERDDVIKHVCDMAYNAECDDNTPFSFAYGRTADGDPYVGDGSDEEPFVVGITTRGLLHQLNRDPSTFIFHIDATFKLSQVGYPVLVLGITDRARKCHLVAFIIISTRIESVYTMALMAFRSIYTEVTGKQIRLKFVMGDDEDGQFNALKQAFRYDSDFVFLMCFFHVMKKVQERSKGLPDRLANYVLSHVYDMHFSPTARQLTQTTAWCLEQWGKSPTLHIFAAYFEKQWLNARYSRWQCCHLEPGFATTNNPVDQFNRISKRDYTLRSRLKMGLLIKVLADCAGNELSERRPFNRAPLPTAPLVRRMKQLAKDEILKLGPTPTGSLLSSLVRVQSFLAPRIYIPSKKRTTEYLQLTAQMGSNYARMEFEWQPEAGWLVDASTGWCECRYWRKFGSCIHVLYARFTSQRVNAQGRRILVNRNIVRKNAVNFTAQGAVAGRPPFRLPYVRVGFLRLRT